MHRRPYQHPLTARTRNNSTSAADDQAKSQTASAQDPWDPGSLLTGCRRHQIAAQLGGGCSMSACTEVPDTSSSQATSKHWLCATAEPSTCTRPASLAHDQQAALVAPQALCQRVRRLQQLVCARRHHKSAAGSVAVWVAAAAAAAAQVLLAMPSTGSAVIGAESTWRSGHASVLQGALTWGLWRQLGVAQGMHVA